MENKKKCVGYVLAGLTGICVLVLADQFTKRLAVEHLAGGSDVVLLPGVFSLHYLENRGAAFGLLQNQKIFFIVLTLVFLAAACWFYLRIPRTGHYLFLHVLTVILAGGAVGNLIDRVRLGYVIDFLYFSLIDFPVFNVADIFVTGAFAGAAIAVLFLYKDDDFSFLRTGGKES